MVDRVLRFGSNFSSCRVLSSSLGKSQHNLCRCKAIARQPQLSHSAGRHDACRSLHLTFNRQRLPPSFPMGQRLSHRNHRPGGGSILRAQDRDAAVERDSVGTAPTGLWIVVGLGNPGPKFSGNRHNVGFMAVDAIARREGLTIDKRLSKALVTRCSFSGQNVLLAKPLTYMNLSGESVSGLAKFYKVPTKKILIIYDDLDTPLASVRLKQKGGHGGHNGIRSLGSHLKGDFPRIKIGVGRPPGNRSVIDHVLQDFSAKEKVEIDYAIQETIKTLESVFQFGMQRALSGMRC